MNNSIIPSSNFKKQKIYKVISNNKNNLNTIFIKKNKFIKNCGNNKRKKNLLSNEGNKENISYNNKNSISSLRRQNSINTSMNCFNKKILNATSGNYL